MYEHASEIEEECEEKHILVMIGNITTYVTSIGSFTLSHHAYNVKQWCPLRFVT
jgi:hypothetical protein